jgi:hypothetical protein
MYKEYRETIGWCSEMDDKVKTLQDFCLDHPLDEETRDILTRLTNIQKEVEILSEDCKKGLYGN